MKKLCALFLLLIFIAVFAVAFPKGKPPHSTPKIFQYSVLSALMAGVYDGSVTCGWLKEKGDMGIGTFTGLDGEMLMLDGKIYQVRSTGAVSPVADEQTSPFANLVFFKPDTTIDLARGFTFADLPKHIEPQLPSLNIFYAIRIDGVFSHVQTRSISRQTAPYKPLAQVAKTQSVFDMNNVEGTMVGFWFPKFAGGLNVPGFHLHFISKDKTKGGHVLDFTVDNATLKLMASKQLNLQLPGDDAFLKTDFSNIKMHEIDAVENKLNDEK